MKKILITGAAGFIGHHLAQRLLKEGYEICGIDNLNDYYDPSLKKARLAQLGVIQQSGPTRHTEYFGSAQHKLRRSATPKPPATFDLPTPSTGSGQAFDFRLLDLQNYEGLTKVFNDFNPDIVINLAAQAGVRYSLENPRSYIESNLDGFFNILEASRQQGVKNFIYASSSSVYGNNEKSPFAETDNVDHPVSLYAATKKSNELMAHTYSHLYQMTTVGLRFFTVYGPWGRPDMAYYFFTKAILAGQKIQLFNHGLNLRDYTYVDDVVESIKRMLGKIDALKPETLSEQYQATQSPYYHLFNIGGSQPVPVLEFVETLEEALGKKAVKELVEFQPGDVFSTQADTTALESFINFKPSITLKQGLTEFVKWYQSYYQK
ncbi:MAG: NAD-dependent epimerase/dehydratase family protein [Candidatus Marinimicrobia bacterium]|nr:NAD-dependent epimerase/dehydratase family protein [Candidatus Neomarinimicrobiota bacterium]MCF7922302.1 NAD-dependent epimerase/dehydratase family protein [Candidatus Neomarinimicrobiota bacterium]